MSNYLTQYFYKNGCNNYSECANYCMKCNNCSKENNNKNLNVLNHEKLNDNFEEIKPIFRR